MAQAPAPAAPTPQTPATPPGGANANRTLSAATQAAVVQFEGQVQGGRYYNDSANHCTYGVGLLAHPGPCTPDELRRTVNPQQAQREFQRRLDEAAQRVRDLVPNRRLTQNQFDAMTSAVFNTRNTDNETFLGYANSGNDQAVLQMLGGIIHTHNHDAHGHPVGPAVVSRGLVRRRAYEVNLYGRPSQ